MVRLMVTTAAYRQSSRVTPGVAGARSRQPAAGPRAAVSPRRRGDPRPGVGGGRAVERQDVRAAGAARRSRRLACRRPSATAWTGRPARARTATAARSTRVAADEPLPVDGHLRCAQPRGLQPRRSRTNTPLQALVTLNDPVYVEAAQALARRMIREAGPDGGGQDRATASACAWPGRQRRPSGSGWRNCTSEARAALRGRRRPRPRRWPPFRSARCLRAPTAGRRGRLDRRGQRVAQPRRDVHEAIGDEDSKALTPCPSPSDCPQGGERGD